MYILKSWVCCATHLKIKNVFSDSFVFCVTVNEWMKKEINYILSSFKNIGINNASTDFTTPCHDAETQNNKLAANDCQETMLFI